MTGMHYLLTGHTGFKGSWAVAVLNALGHRVSGIALDPAPGALFTAARVDEMLEHDLRVDIRDRAEIRSIVERVRPDVVLHFAAQPLVRASYDDPVGTIETNVLGTMNLLEAVRATSSVQAQLIITTDKVYQNVNRAEGYREGEPLGAADPYSTSKAMADLLVQSWVKSFPGPPTAIARGGNVIGGGDHATDRLLPDVMRAFDAQAPALLRFPDSVRPWQHVLDCVSGYVAIVDALLAGNGTGAWNIGPGPESFVSVAGVADRVVRLWGEPASWHRDQREHQKEAALLALDPGKAQRELGWSGKLKYPASVDWTVEWEMSVRAGTDPRSITERQIVRYLGLSIS